MPTTDFLTYVLQHHAAPTTLIICSTRQSFLSDLSAIIGQPSSSVPTGDSSPSTPPEDPSPHPLLIPTIHLISTSRTVALAFAPTLPHLRAYLATYSAPSGRADPQPHFSKPGSRTPMLAVLNPLALHSSTTDFSAQGLSRTFAAAVEAADRAGMQLVVQESERGHDEDAEAGVHPGEEQGEGEGTGEDPWRQQVPLLNGSVRMGGGGERLWAGRMVEVGKVVGRWCRFMGLDEGGLYET